MNIVMKNSIRYCGNSTLAAIMALSMGNWKKQDVCIVTDDMTPYNFLFKKLNMDKDILVNDQTKELAILKANGLTDQLKCYCYPINRYVYILHVDNKDIITGMTKTMYYADARFIYDIKDFRPDPKTIRYFVKCFTNDNTIKKELIDNMAALDDQIERKRTIFICNKFDYGYDNQKKIANELGLRITDIIYFRRSLLMKQFINKNKFEDFVNKCLMSEPLFEIYTRQLQELIELGG